MKLHYSPRSPFVRKVLVCAHEKGLDSRIELIETDPWASPDALTSDNPLSKVPALTLDDGSVIFDSPVICEYLDTLAPAPVLFPQGPARWEALVGQALADGICDAAVLRRMEMMRPADQQSPDWFDRQARAVERALDRLEQVAPGIGERLDIGTIAIGCALGYLDFRWSHEDWRGSRPALAGWYKGFAARESMKGTVPVG